MEHYEKKISFLGENIQTIRKHRGMKQQELADKIGINMQSLSKIERGVNYPTFDTLEKIMDVLGVTPNELLSGEWKYIDHTEPYIMDIIKREQDFNVSLDYCRGPLPARHGYPPVHRCADNTGLPPAYSPPWHRASFHGPA